MTWEFIKGSINFLLFVCLKIVPKLPLIEKHNLGSQLSK